MSSSIPSEKRLASKWEDIGYLFTQHFLVGLTVGGLASIVMFRTGTRAPFRVACSFYGAGVGTGIAYTKSSKLMDSEVRSFK